MLLQISSSAAVQAVQSVTTAVADTTHMVATTASVIPTALPPDSFNLLSMLVNGGAMMIPLCFLLVLSI
ncbi:MAG: hypothetical protein ABI448_01495, partial [Bacteroidia bacterium]